MSEKIDKIEKEKRIRIVQEWLVEDWTYGDVVAQIINKWGVAERQAKRYVAEARERWISEEQEKLDLKRTRKILKLKKLARSLKDPYKGTPAGVRAILAVEKEIISLEAIRPAIKLEVSGKDGKAIETETKHTVVFENYAE